MNHGGEAAEAGAVREREAEANIRSGRFDGQLGALPGSFSGAHPRFTWIAPQARAVAAPSDAPVAAAVVRLHLEPGVPGVAYPNFGEFRRQLGLDDVAPLDAHAGVVRGYALQLRPGARHGEVLVGLLVDGAGVVYNNYYMWQRSPATGHGEVFVGPLPDGVGPVFHNFLAQQTLPGIGLGAGYDNPGMDVVAQHLRLRRLLPLAGIGACSVAVNGLAAGPGSPDVAFHLFVLLLAGLLLVILHVLRV